MSAQTEVLPPRYENCERIGRGGMGDIYLAHDRQLARKVAIKVLAERFASDADVRGRFKREALTAARLSGHPHIVTIFDVGEWNDRPHIVMEYLARGSLADRNRDGRVRTSDALDWLQEAAEALDAAHVAGIVHRDVKPANLLFDGRDELNVADFGIARVLDQTTVGMTVPGTVMGTSGYLSPEQANGEQATAASDIYALGVVAFELLTGGRPFARRSSTAEAAAHLHDPVPRASDRRPELTDEVDDVFARVLAKDPAARHASAGEFVADLRAAVEAGEQVTRPVPLPARPAGGGDAPARVGAPPRRRSPLLPLVAALLLLGGGALAAVLLTRDDGNKQAVVTRTVRSIRTARVTAAGTTVVVPTTVSRTVTLPATAAPPPPPPPTPPATSTPSVPVTAPPPASPPAAGTPSVNEAIRLTDQAKAANDSGDYATGARLGRRAVQGLQGSGQIYEAYAYYNYAVSLLGTGRCADALSYFNRSEAIQGHRSEIDRGRRDARNCAGAGNGNGKLKPGGGD
jgi:eukaryotic-like serine/threonine-protein kinase